MECSFAKIVMSLETGSINIAATKNENNHVFAHIILCILDAK